MREIRTSGSRRGVQGGAANHPGVYSTVKRQLQAVSFTPTAAGMLDSLLAPRSIAVIGASRSANTIGWQILDNLLRHGYTGAVYPVNPSARAVHSIPAYASVEEIPDEVEMAVVVVPKQHVCAVAEACGRKGVKGLVVISAGFREVRGEGVAREEALREVAKRYGKIGRASCRGRG